MPKTKISEYSTTNADNTDIEGINIAEGCAPSGINNAIREIMVHLKEFQTGASGDGFTFAGGTLMTGTNTLSGTNVLSGSTTAAFAAGTVSAPSIYASGDTNTGIFFPAADTIAFAEGGAEAMRIDSSGNVGIGRTSLNYKFEVSQTSDLTVGLYNSSSVTSGNRATITALNSDASSVGYIRFGAVTDNVGTDIQFATRAAAGSLTERMRIDSSGNVGIGTSTIEANTNYNTLEIAGKTSSGGAVIRLKTGDRSTAKTMLFCDTAGFEQRVETAHPIVFSTNNTEKARITSGGRLLVGTTTENTNGGVLQVSNGITFPATQSASSDANTLDDYEEGTWTPTDASGAGLTFTDVTATYTKIGRMVFAQFALQYPSTANGSNSLIGGMPFAPASGNSARQGFVSYTDEATLALILPEGGGATTAAPRTNAGAQITNATMSLNSIWGELVYFV